MDGLDIRYANSLSAIYEHVHDIYENGRKDVRNLLWFRGQEYEHYNLEPNLFRGADYLYNKTETYSQNHLREEYRFQSFMARNFDKLGSRIPQTMIEWQEVMQHYSTKTRLMDWSESLFVSLEFALESFIKPIEDREVAEHRRTATPVLWILEPANLNREVYKAVMNAPISMLKKAMDFNSKNSGGLARRVKKELQEHEQKGTYYNLSKESDGNMNVMVSLSALELIRDAYSGKEFEALWNFAFNPFFYLLLRYYSDGVPVEMDKLPPLAIIHPYHSPRIESQRGVFTIFPYYIPNEQHKKMKDILKKDPPIAMEYMEMCVPYLHKINILDPHGVAEELMMTGAKRGNLYPDMQIISEDMENIVSIST